MDTLLRARDLVAFPSMLYVFPSATSGGSGRLRSYATPKRQFEDRATQTEAPSQLSRHGTRRTLISRSQTPALSPHCGYSELAFL